VETIKETIEGLLKNIKVQKEKAAGITPECLAKKIFSRKELEHVQTALFKNGILYLKVDSSTWLYYFNLHKRIFQEKFFSGNSRIKELKFSLGGNFLQKNSSRPRRDSGLSL